MNVCLPVDGDRHKGEDARRDGAGGDELCHFAVDPSEGPMTRQHVDEVEHRIEDGDERVGDGEVDEEVVRHRAHALEAEHDPDDDDVSAGGDEDHRHEGDDVDELEVPGEDVLIADEAVLAAASAGGSGVIAGTVVGIVHDDVVHRG